MSLERHARFENGSFGARKFEFELGADDARLDETPTRFAHEIIVHRRRDSDDPAGQAPRPHGAPHVIQINRVGKFVSLYNQRRAE
jgi:hypothetical protein